MALELAATGVCTLLASVSMTGVIRWFALSHGLIDVPNERSSHRTPTPRGGGASIVVSTTVALGVLSWLRAVPAELVIALSGGGMAVAVVGLLDDQQRVSAPLRFVVHVMAAVWAVAWLGGLPPVRVGDNLITFGWPGYPLAVLGIVWVLNLFNFMDGIDGIAASEGTFVAWTGAMLGPGQSSGVAAAGLILGAACLGFLPWNWKPARIFMGDVASGYVGYVIAVLALAAAQHDPVALWVWLILGATFFVDATVTLLRRLRRREHVSQAHRTHAYQWLARRWGSHAKVTSAAMLINVLWLLPCAICAVRWPELAGEALICALVPLVLLASAISGRREASDVRTPVAPNGRR